MNRKQLKSLEYKALALGKNNPAKILLKSLKEETKINSLVKAILQNNEEMINQEIKKKNNLNLDEYGYSPLDYASVLENANVFKKLKSKSKQYIPVFGYDYQNKDKPLLNNFAFDNKTILNKGDYFLYSPYNFLECKNLNEAIKKVFPNAGKKTFKLISPFMETEYGDIDFTAFHFAHYCSVYMQDANHFNEILENIKNVHFYEKLIPLHFILERMNENRIKNFIIEAGKMEVLDVQTMAHDTLTQYKGILKACHDEYEIDFKAITSLKQLHDSITEDFRLINRHGENMMLFLERKFPYLDSLKKKKFRDFDIIIPQDKATLIEWGTKLSNCIGGYGDSARDGRTIVFALYKDNEVKHNIEVAPDGKIRQFVSDANRPVDQNMRAELQTMIDEYKDTMISEDGEVTFRMPIDQRFLVKVLKTDSPVNEESSFFNELFLMNLSPTYESTETIETQKINGFKENIPRGAISLILEDKNSKASLIKSIASLEEKVAYTGLLKHFKTISNAENMKEKDFNKLKNSIENQVNKGIKTFFIGINRIVNVKGKTPSALSTDDFNNLESNFSDLLEKGINIFLVVSDVKKAKILNYKNDKELEKIAHQIFYTYKDKAISNNMNIDVTKNIYGANNCVWKVKGKRLKINNIKYL